jgi:tRNA(Ile)-lysidine synthase
MALSKIRRDPVALVTDAVARAAECWKPDANVCVALSGGLDSTVLLHSLATLRQQQAAGWTLSAHHVHHGLSVHADKWAAHCESLCTSLGVPLTVERVVVDQQAGIGIEAAAREARFASLDRVKANIVVMAHHAQDQAETLLLQLLRGAGPAGMAAMPATDGRYERPLLAVPKAAIRDYAKQFALSWIEDESNLDNRFARNRLRNLVWSELVAAFPSAETTLVRAAQHQADVSQLLDELAQIDAVDCICENTLALPAFNAQSDARRANLLRFWLRTNGIEAPATTTLHDWLRQLRSVADEQAVELRGFASSAGRSVTASATAIRVYRDRAYLCGETRFWQPAPWHGEAALELRSNAVMVGQVGFRPEARSESIRGPRPGEQWLVRSRREGDAIALSGRSGHVALKNVFQQAGVPPWLRLTWPLLTCNDQLVSVISIATAKAFTVAPGEWGVICEWKPAWALQPRS